jgi:pyrroloquinoline quinone (PQQ) biosynthesis protein C
MCWLVLLQGDQLIATSGVTYSTEEEYGEVKVKKGQKVVRVNAIGQVGC